MKSNLDIMQEDTGIVIPIYHPARIDTAQGELFLTDTVRVCCHQVDDPSLICLSVDGEDHGAEVAKQLSKQFGVSAWVSPQNRGKFHAVAVGARLLLEGRNPPYVAVVDQDGDHSPNELLNFVRLAQHIAGRCDTDRVLILGQRISLHRPMGFFRGELEELADRVLLDALFYRATVTRRPLRLEYVTSPDGFPDFHSGYKLFSRTTARDVFLGEPQLAGASEDAYYHHACEAVMVVEALEQGARLGSIHRTAVNQQPISTFGLYDLSQLTADLIIWPCKRLEIPPEFVRQWMANHVPRLLMSSTISDGKDILEQVIHLVMAAFDQEIDGSDSIIYSPYI